MEKQIILNNIPTNYKIDEQGNVFNIKTGKKMAVNDGRVQLYVEGKNKRCTVGSLVASAFIENNNPQELTMVGHKDGNHLNNAAGNLYWMSPRDNQSNTWEKRRENGTTGAGVTKMKRENIVEIELLTLEDNEKQVVIDDEAVPYAIRIDGRVRNLKTGNVLKGALLGSYRYFNLRWNKKQKNKAHHQLLATAFLDNPNNYTIVDHIDGDRLNNNIENLRWVSPKENSKNIHLDKTPTPPKFEIAFSQQELEAEEWKQYKDTKYLVSNLGRVKGKRGQILSGRKLQCGYISYTIDDKRLLGQVLVYSTFFGDKKGKTDINHKDGNKWNNRISNLEEVTHQENMRKATEETNAWSYSTVGEFDQDGVLLKIYKNASDAARTIGITPGAMRNTIRRQGRCYNGLAYRYLDK